MAEIDNVQIGEVLFTIIDNVATMSQQDAVASAGFLLTDIQINED